MKRREFLALVGSTVVCPLGARSQPPGKLARVGYLGLGPASAQEAFVEALRMGLRDLGYVEGKNIVILFRWAEGVDRLPGLANELVGMNVDLIFALSSTQVEPARQATKTIPIVFAIHADPVGTGHVASLAQPGGTGTYGCRTLRGRRGWHVGKECAAKARYADRGIAGFMPTDKVCRMGTFSPGSTATGR
jgi:putative tryptophan/tyrosine transport system substrate-binding protein